jgi:hypothetical protein
VAAPPYCSTFHRPGCPDEQTDARCVQHVRLQPAALPLLAACATSRGSVRRVIGNVSANETGAQGMPTHAGRASRCA